MNTKINYPQYGHIYKYITWSDTHSKNFYYPHTHLNLKKITPTYICNLNVQEISYTFFLFLKHEMSYTSNGRREKQAQTFSTDEWTGESKIFTNVVKKWARTALSRAKNSKNKWAEWLGREERERNKGGKEFCPGWCFQSGQKAPVLASRWTRDKSHLLSRAQR